MSNHWPLVKLRSCVDLLAGFPFKSKEFSERNEDIALVKGENVSQGFILWHIAKRWPVADWGRFAKFQLRPADVVVAMDRPWVPAGLKWAYIRPSNPKALLVQRCARLRTNTSLLEQTFLRYVIGSPRFESYVIPITSGVSVPHLSGSQILNYEFTLPPREVQRRIAKILSAYDDQIENCQRRIQILEAMCRSLYREWFVEFRFPEHNSVPRVASALGEIPEEWSVTALAEVTRVFRGRSYRSGDLTEQGGLPFLNLKCIDRDGGFRTSGLKRYIGEYKPHHVARCGDIVMAVTDMTQERRIVARAALVPVLDHEIGITSMDLVRIEPSDPLPKLFLYAMLRYSSFADEVKQHANGANVLHLAPERISDFRMVMPPHVLMARFQEIVAPMVSAAQSLEVTTEKLRRTRDLLLPRLMSGQLTLDAE